MATQGEPPRCLGDPVPHLPIPHPVRRAVLAHAGATVDHPVGTCESCGEREFLELHHRTYENAGHEDEDDLAALCRDCSRQEHLDSSGDFWTDPEEKADHWPYYYSEMEKG